MKQLVIINKKNLKRKGVSEEKIQQYNRNTKLNKVKNDKEFLSEQTLLYSEISAICDCKKGEKENNILRLYCTLSNNTENVKCNMKKSRMNE